MMRLLLSLLLLLSFLQINAQTYPKVILLGDYPDPSIMRDGKDYYMTHSPFYYAPGFLIWHSQDLMNWEPLCRVMPQYEGSAMAPDLLKYKDTYYIYYPAAGTNWVMWAKDIRGPWSLPVDLKVGGIDPGHVVDREGNRYLYVDKGEVIRLTEDGLATVGEKKKVYDGWKYPDHWDTECMCLESPKLNEHNGYYYLTSAQGGTAGPATSHMVVSARSKSVIVAEEIGMKGSCLIGIMLHEIVKGHVLSIDEVNAEYGEEVAEQIKALKDMKVMGEYYGLDLSRPAYTAQEAVQWVYMAYLAAVKEQDGAAMSLGNVSSFLDIYMEYELSKGTITESFAQELIDQFVIKLRMVRHLRMQSYNDIFAGDPTWVTESLGGRLNDGRTKVTKTSFRFLQTLYNLGPSPEPNLTVLWSPELPEGFKEFCAKVTIDTS